MAVHVKLAGGHERLESGQVVELAQVELAPSARRLVGAEDRTRHRVGASLDIGAAGCDKY